MNEQNESPVEIDPCYLTPTDIIDSEHPDVVRFALETIEEAGRDPVNKAVRLYYAVRDGVWYDPYYPFYLPEHYRASVVLKRGRGYCVSKAALLCAVGRVCGIPSRIGLADVRNHITTTQLLEVLGTNIFTHHGYTEFYLNGKWVKATPAFNIELCRKHEVEPLEFNGMEDSIFHQYNPQKKLSMEYLADHGSFADIPLDKILSAWRKVYGEEKVRKWIKAIEKSGGKSWRDFESEEVWKSD